MHEYKIRLEAHGGEVTIGSIAVSTQNYWDERGIEDLESHITLDNVSNVPTEHNLYPPFKIDDLIHTNGVELTSINQLQVMDLSSVEVAFESFLNEDRVLDNAWVINDKPPVAQPDQVFLKCASIKQGYWEYETILTEERFDEAKLELFIYHVDGIFIVDHLAYDGTKLKCIEISAQEKEFQVSFC